jgi:hypothetical protein
MTGVVVAALCLAFVAGLVVRSHFAHLAAARWHAERERLRSDRRRILARLSLVQGQLDEAIAADYLRDLLGEDGWLYDALSAVHTEILPGEQATNLTIEVTGRDGGRVVIGIDRGDRAERALLLTRTDGYHMWQEPHDARVPDTPEGLTG